MSSGLHRGGVGQLQWIIYHTTLVLPRTRPAHGPSTRGWHEMLSQCNSRYPSQASFGCTDYISKSSLKWFSLHFRFFHHTSLPACSCSHANLISASDLKCESRALQTAAGGGSAPLCSMADGNKHGTACRTCRRRGRRCDKTLPACKACDQRRVQCEGYVTRWPGVAARGKLAGKTVPVVLESPAESVARTENPGQTQAFNGLLDQKHFVDASDDLESLIGYCE